MHPFAPGLAMAESALPPPAAAPERPGVGFLIAHQGRTGNDTGLAWWDRENELPLRVFISPDRQPRNWRPNETGESICVRELEILRAEREAFVTTMLSPPGSDTGEYIARVAGSPEGKPPRGTRAPAAVGPGRREV